MTAELRDLRDTQELLGELLRRFEPIDAHPDAAARAAVCATVSGNERLTPEQQAEIYRDQFWLRHRDSLREDFPALLSWIGADAFDDLARAYLLAYPPSSWTLRELGHKLGEFADGYTGFAPQLARAARDLCRYELAFVAIFDAPDVASIDLAKVEAILPEAWSSAKIAFCPALALLSFNHPVHRYRAAVRAGEAPPPLEPEPTFLALWRAADLRVAHVELEASELRLLRSLHDGLGLGEACERAATQAGIEPERFAALLRRWFASWGKRGWIVDA